MCIAIVKPRGVSLAEDRLRICFENNPDGAGFAIATDKGVEIHKGYTTFMAFLTAYLEYRVDEHAALVHFRITTRGENSARNHHPFPVAAGALVHNGTIGWLGKAGKGPSDTALFADLLQDMTVAQWHRLRPMIEHSTGWSRFALLTHEGEALLFNQQEWDEADGALYSNDTYLPEPGVEAGASLYGQDPFRWESNLTLTRLMPDGTLYRDEDLERDVLQEWVACYGEPPMDAWAWAVLDQITHDYIEEEHHAIQHLHAA
ncbi:MAG: hypothetical protein ABIR55_12180 [Burkholderiaceae bacterium]